MGDYEERARKPAAKPIEQSGHKEASWVQPNTSSSGTHVGSIFFRTKEHSIDARDRQLLDSLAGAYGQYAERDKGKHTGAPVTANVVGYADPRASHAPDNESLSEARATTVAGALDHAFERSGIDKTLGFVRTDHAGAGVDPAAPTGHEDSVEANVLAPFRRADIFVHGKADGRGIASDPQVDTSDSRPKPPDYSDRRHGLDGYAIMIARGHRRSMDDVATYVLAHLHGSIDADLRERYYYYHIKAVEPPWWNTRDQTPVEPMGRGGASQKTADEQLQVKALGLASDFRLYAYYAMELHDQHVETRWLATRDPADAAKLGHLVFMQHALEEEANDVKRGLE